MLQEARGRGVPGGSLGSLLGDVSVVCATKWVWAHFKALLSIKMPFFDYFLKLLCAVVFFKINILSMFKVLGSPREKQGRMNGRKGER